MKQCSKHPKFKGNKKPSYQCGECALLYLNKKGRRIPIPPPNQAHKTAKDYRRSEKHKKKFDVED